MKTYYGNYLGIVINGGQNDPERRGRCQIFIPHIMPALYEGWNKEGVDRNISILGDNLLEQGALTSEEVDKLKVMLPWAECATPIVAAGPSARMGPDGNMYESLGNTGYMPGSLSRASAITGTGSFGDVVATISPKDNKSSNAHLDVRWRGKTRVPGGPIEVPSLDLIGKYVQVGGIPANQLRITDGPTEADGSNFSTGRSFERHPAWDLAFQTPGAIAGAPVTLTNGARVIDSEDTSYGSSTAIVETPEGVLELLHLTTGSVRVGAGSLPSFQDPPLVNPSGRGGGSVGDGFPDVNNYPSTDQETAQYGVSVSESGAVSPTNLNAYLRQRLQNSSLIGKGANVLSDAQKFGIKEGSVDEWANFFTKLAEKENAEFNTNKVFTENFRNSKGELVRSTGLFQVSYESVKGYGIGKDLTDTKLDQALRDPTFNANAAVTIFEQNLADRNSIIQTRDGVTAGAGYFAMTSMNKIAADAEAGLMAEFAAAKGAPMIQNPAYKLGPDGQPVPFGSSHGPDTNNLGTGMFGYAREGQFVWCFFQEGDPHFPVYFAASYGQKEWNNAMQRSSPGGGEIGHQETVLKLDGGGIRSTQTFGDINQSGLPNDFAFEVFGQFGHNLRFGTDTVELNSLYNFRQQTEGDHHDITLANRETRTMGDDNHVIGQDCFVTIGNWNTSAQEAAARLQKIVNEGMEIGSS